MILLQYPNLSVGIFHTTYTYLNTILDGEQPIVLSSRHTVTNTVTAPDDYLSLLKPSETRTALKNTNTYYSTINLEKTLYEGDKTQVTSTNEVVTQVIITESVPPRATSVMTSYIALDVEDNPSITSYSTTDVVKTYFVTYTYYNTLMENGKQVVHKNISTSSDIVTEKIYIQPKRTPSLATTHLVKDEKKKQKIDISADNFHILATKTYFTTFTYLTTLLQNNDRDQTVISSSTKVVENLVTETLHPSLLDPKYLKVIRSDINDGSDTVIKVATLQDGQKLEVTAIANADKPKIKPTSVLPIEKTAIPEKSIDDNKIVINPSSSPSTITGSTIVFVDDDPFAQFAATPQLSTKTLVSSTDLQNKLESLLSSEVVKSTKASTSKSKRATKSKNKTHVNTISPTKSKGNGLNSTSKRTNPTKLKTPVNKNKQTTSDKVVKPVDPSSDLLGLGSINVNSLQALTPVLNAMAGLITNNLKSNRRSDVNVTSTTTTTTSKPILKQKLDDHVTLPAVDTQNRSPIYIPVGGFSEDFEIAESQNIANFDWVDHPRNDQIIGKTAQEASLLNGGIPISPGDIITANSDVIVGKPGRVGPRIPAIPLNRGPPGDDVPIDMKPPPVPSKLKPKNRHEYRHIPVKNNQQVSNVIHVPNKDDYVGPPPPLPSPYRDDKIKRIPLNPQGSSPNPYYDLNDILPHQQVYAESQTNYDPNHVPTNLNHEHNYYSLQESIMKNYESAAKQSYPVYAQEHAKPIPGTPINEYNIAPSVINEPIVLPEIIERSSGQPLLVNIQPSQVAFVAIPFNRTTALIYGGSTEPHKNGQYFDDPSPYPEPEFGGVEVNNGVPHLASGYQDQHLNQKQVNGIITVGTHQIHVEPDVSANQQIPNINPSKPQITVGSNQEISINVPPISFGVHQQGNDFNAHVINHGNIQFRPPATPYEVVKPQSNTAESVPIGYPNTGENLVLSNEVPPPDISPPRRPQAHFTRPVFHNKPDDLPNDVFNRNNPDELYAKPIQNKPKYPIQGKESLLGPKHPRPEAPVADLAEYMTPPPVSRNTPSKRPNFRRPPIRRPLPIPLIPSNGGFKDVHKPKHPIPMFNTHPHTIPLGHEDNNFIPSSDHHSTFTEDNASYPNTPPYHNLDSDIGDHREDDQENDDGEVIQESNSRPLLPGEVPIEILKAQTSTTSSPLSTTQRNMIRFPENEQTIRYRPTVSEKARPFLAPGIRENNNNQIDSSSRYTSKPHLIPISDNRFEYTSTETPVKVTKGPRPNGLVVVGNQFENNDSSEQFFVSGSQFTNVVPPKYNNFNNKTKSVQRKPSRLPPIILKDATTTEVNHVRTKKPIPLHRPTTSTTKKPILIFIDENGNENTNFFNKRPSYNNRNERPAVTSLPIDSVVVPQAPPRYSTQKYDSQTEKPFVPDRNPSLSSNQIIIKDDITTKKVTTSTITSSTRATTTSHTTTTTEKQNIVDVEPDLNTGEVTWNYDNTTISDLEIMKPPPPPTNIPVDEPNTEMQPPKPVQEPPRSDIFTIPNTQTETPFKSHPAPSSSSTEERLPHVVTTTEVLGMSPPPLVVSNKPPPPVINKYVPNNIPFSRPLTSTSTEGYKYTTRRRIPYTRRPGYYQTSTTPSSTTLMRRRPIYNLYNATSRTITKPTTTKPTITPSPTLKSRPSMEIIIGNPDLRVDEAKVTTKASDSKVMEVIGSEMPTSQAPTEKTTTLSTDHSNVPSLENSEPSVETTEKYEDPPRNYSISKGVHHAGNEVKIVDEPKATTTPALVTTKEKTTLPTRYITYTKTATVTITKTSIVKTLGMPPSTMTILVTKTEKTTIVDTVTETSTLLKPTSIIETITTTVHQGSSLYPPDVYGSPYPSIQIQPSSTSTPILQVTSTAVGDSVEDYDDGLEDFIIAETDPPISREEEEEPLGNDSIFVVMTDKNTKNVIKHPESSEETLDRDEIIETNEVDNIRLGGIFISNNNPAETAKDKDKCLPECKPSRNELCQKVEGVMRCICRPGFARMFPDRPCLRKYQNSYL